MVKYLQQLYFSIKYETPKVSSYLYSISRIKHPMIFGGSFDPDDSFP